MNIAREIDFAKARHDELEAKKDFLQAGLLIAGSRLRDEAIRKAYGRSDIPTRVADLLKKAVSEAVTTSSGGINLGTTGTRYVNTLRNHGAFDAIAPEANPIPLGHAVVAVDATAITISEVGEAAAKPVRRFLLQATSLSPTKVVAQIVASNELIDAIEDAGLRLIDRALTAAASVGADTVMLAALTGNSVDSAGVGGISGFWIDLEEAVRAVGTGNGSRLYAILDPTSAKVLSLALLPLGLNVPASNYQLGPVTVLATDAQTPGRISVLDARGLAIGQSPMELRTSTEAAIEMTDAPSGSSSVPTAANLVSLWQTNSVAMLAERSLVVKAIRTNAHYHITGSPLYAVDSPIP